MAGVRKLFRNGAAQTFVFCDQEADIAPDQIAVKTTFIRVDGDPTLEVNIVADAVPGRRRQIAMQGGQSCQNLLDGLSLHLRPELDSDLVEILRFDRGFPSTKALEGGRHGFH
jgi:hypothetical protein